MKTIPSTLLATTVASLLAFPVLGQEVVTPEQTQNEYTYRYQNMQGDLTGDRLMTQDRDQQRLKTQLHDPELAADRDQLQTQTRTRSQLMQDSSSAGGSQVKSMSRNQNNFLRQSMGSRNPGAGRH